GDPPRAIAETAHVPAAISGELGKLSERFVTARGWEAVRIDTRTRRIPRHDDRNDRRLDRARNFFKQRHYPGIRQKLGIRSRGPLIQLALNSNDNVGRRVQQPFRNVSSHVKRTLSPGLPERPLPIQLRRPVPISGKGLQPYIVLKTAVTLRRPITHMRDAQAASCRAM